jgi:hypothetical protein
MADMQLTLSVEERDFLVQLLETALKNHRIEEHRTKKPSYREQILQEETVISELLTRLSQPPK